MREVSRSVQESERVGGKQKGELVPIAVGTKPAGRDNFHPWTPQVDPRELLLTNTVNKSPLRHSRRDDGGEAAARLAVRSGRCSAQERVRLVNPMDTPLEVLGGGLYLLFDPRVSSRRGELLPKFRL